MRARSRVRISSDPAGQDFLLLAMWAHPRSSYAPVEVAGVNGPQVICRLCGSRYCLSGGGHLIEAAACPTCGYAGWVPLSANGPARIASVASMHAPAYAASGFYELRRGQ